MTVCFICKSYKSEKWWKCCPKHTTQNGPDTVCDECRNLLHPYELPTDSSSFLEELSAVINRHSAENGSNTPDFLLAQFLVSCLAAWNVTTIRRDSWYGINPSPGGVHDVHNS